MASECRLCVAVRVKPLLRRAGSCLRLDHKLVALLDKAQRGRKEWRQQHFEFDWVLGEQCTQEEIFQVAQPYLNWFLQGYNTTVLAYGATGAGKTFTMEGTKDQPGLMPRAANFLFARQQESKSVCKASYFQVYNETIRDLLQSGQRSLQLRQDPKNGTTVVGASQHRLDSLQDFSNLLRTGAKNRTKQATQFNEVSSRSHGVLVFSSQLREHDGTSDKVTFSKLFMVDLAGSEKAGCNRGQRLVQGNKINQSLLTLGNCIQALAASQGGFVPFRGSKLTRLLKESLGGNCKTVMFSTVVGTDQSYEETRNTLLYSSRARTIRSRLYKNVVSVQNHVSTYLHILDDLKRENIILKQRGSQSNPSPSIEPSDLEAARVLQAKINSHFSAERERIVSRSKSLLEVELSQVKAGRSANSEFLGPQEQPSEGRRQLQAQIHEVSNHFFRIQLLTKMSQANAALERIQIQESESRMRELSRYQDHIIEDLQAKLALHRASAPREMRPRNRTEEKSNSRGRSGKSTFELPLIRSSVKDRARVPFRAQEKKSGELNLWRRQLSANPLGAKPSARPKQKVRQSLLERRMEAMRRNHGLLVNLIT